MAAFENSNGAGDMYSDKRAVSVEQCSKAEVESEKSQQEMKLQLDLRKHSMSPRKMYQTEVQQLQTAVL